MFTGIAAWFTGHALFGPVIAFLGKVPGWVWLVLLSLLVLGGVYWAGSSAGKKDQTAKAAQTEVKTQQSINNADNNAAAARVTDAVRLQQQTQELKDAVRDAKSPDDARTKRGCAIMRQQGRDTSGIAACR